MAQYPGRNNARPRSGQSRPAPQNRAPLSLEERQRRAASRRAAQERARAERVRQMRIQRIRRRRLFILSSLLALVIVAGYYTVLVSGLGKAQEPKEAYPVQVFRAGEKEAMKTYTVQETYVNGDIYLPLSALQEFVTVTQYGDHARRSLSLSNGDSVTFDLGTPNCVVNGVQVSLTAPVFIEGEELYLPVDFFYRRMNCFEYAFSSPLNANVLTYLSDVTPALTSHVMTASPRIDPATVPAAPAA